MTWRARFDVGGYIKAIEDGDVDYQTALYVEDAEVRIVDPDNPPANPRIILGRRAITQWMTESCQSTVEHSVVSWVKGQGRLAVMEREHYADGGVLFTSFVLDLDQARISRQDAIQVWDWPE